MRFRDFHPNIKIRLGESFVSSLIGSMVMPFMTIYLAMHFGAKVAGILLLVNVFLGIGMSLLGGYFSDVFGRRKIMLLAESLRLVAFLTMMLSNSPWFESPAITYSMIMLNSLCWGLAGPANDAMLIDVSTPDQRRLIYSIGYWASNLSVALGGIAGAFMFENYLFELFMALSIAAAATLFIVYFFISETHFPAKAEIRPLQHITQIFGTYRNVMQDRLFVWFIAGGILVLSMEFQLTSYIGIRLSEEMPTQQFLFWEVDGVKMMGFLRSENTILVVLLALFTAKLITGMKDRFVLVTSCLVFTMGYAALTFSTNIWVLFIMMAVLTVGEVFRVPVEQSYMAAIPPDDKRSAYMAFGGLQYNLAMLIVSLTVTLSGYLSSVIMGILLTLIGLFGTFILFGITPNLDRRKLEAEQRAG
ncbi:MFS transporter, DHA1 family, multidrug resistance protein B [Terribacillus aidingensis]|uniref:MFS transporter, DHA1 family, multidrug resistance protein B n=1 Tax=Terribacillus aidingensis TaxID=586416 RepID=A0A285N4N9_9BACI|nr:MFS transporter [Terribacillus aidingensis]SNZ03787.1 MFS transporter, DHA1 family, multidrug resistance protein B [Terribacillus aidingensis]